MLFDEANLRECFRALRKDAAPGIDRVTFDDYERDLDANLAALVERLKRKRHHARLVRRVNIPQGGGKLRPLGLPVLEDKLLQMAVAKVLTAIYEEDFLPMSRGCRPGGNAKETSRDWAATLGGGGCAWVVDADIKGFFEHVDHDWMLKMLELRIDDKPFLRLVRKWLKAGVLETDGRVVHPTEGTPQGGVVSPVLANIYLHYALGLWLSRVVVRKSQGRCAMPRYADDFVVAFERREDAERFLEEQPGRLGKFGLELSGEKTRLVRFERGNPSGDNGGFDFLGFRCHWEKTRRGNWKVQRRTAPSRLQRSAARLDEWFKANRSERLPVILAGLRRKLAGYWQYYGVSGNWRSLAKFWRLVEEGLCKWLNRRSQKRGVTWARLGRMLERHGVPRPRIVPEFRQMQFSFMGTR
ncbi:MAG: group II intron reverse transcriptase/maturase [Kiritimatiellia bacterium]